MCVFVLVYCCCIRFHLRQSLQDYWSAVPSFHKSTTDASTRDRAYYSTTVLLVETIVSLFLHTCGMRRRSGFKVKNRATVQ